MAINIAFEYSGSRQDRRRQNHRQRVDAGDMKRQPMKFSREELERRKHYEKLEGKRSELLRNWSRS